MPYNQIWHKSQSWKLSSFLMHTMNICNNWLLVKSLICSFVHCKKYAVELWKWENNVEVKNRNIFTIFLIQLLWATVYFEFGRIQHHHKKISIHRNKFLASIIFKLGFCKHCSQHAILFALTYVFRLV